MAAMATTPIQGLTGRETLDLAFSQLLALLPAPAGRWLAWLRTPQGVWLRIPAGVLCLVAAAFWFLPVIGIEWLPVGLLLLAEDLPFLRKPVGRFILFLVRQWRRLQVWKARRR